MFTKEDLNSCVKKVVQDLFNAGYKDALSKNTYTISFNKTAKKTLGSCTKFSSNLYSIELNYNYAQAAPLSTVHNTVMHEFIHSLPNCMSHGEEWKRIADIMSVRGYDICRTSTCKEYSEAQIKNAKYVLKCQKCGAELPAYRMSNFVRNPSSYRHNGCDGVFVRIK